MIDVDQLKSKKIQCLDCGVIGFEPIVHHESCKPSDREKDVVNDFTLFELAVVDINNTQYCINAQYLESYIQPGLQKLKKIESIPWNEIIGRKITSICKDKDKIIFGLSTKEK